MQIIHHTSHFRWGNYSSSFMPSRMLCLNVSCSTVSDNNFGDRLGQRSQCQLPGERSHSSFNFPYSMICTPHAHPSDPLWFLLVLISSDGAICPSVHLWNMGGNQLCTDSSEVRIERRFLEWRRQHNCLGTDILTEMWSKYYNVQNSLLIRIEILNNKLTYIVPEILHCHRCLWH